MEPAVVVHNSAVLVLPDKRRLNLGCGTFKIDDYINVDINPEVKPDVVHDCATPFDYASGSFFEIRAIHMFEHLSRDEAVGILPHWYELLAHGGMLVLELPDMYELAKRYMLDLDPKCLEWIFGEQSRDGQYHKWGWSKPVLADELEKVGFKVNILPPRDHVYWPEVCFRIEAIK